MSHDLYTVGHSNHSLAHFVLLLREHQIDAVADVRSSPFSRRQPQFSQRNLAESLSATSGIRYVYLGQQLGARPEDPECFDSEGRVSYDRLAATLSFRNGLRRILKGLETYRIALMCAEHDPLDCHRGILIAPRILPHVSNVLHIAADGRVETHAEAERRLLTRRDLPEHALFHSESEQLQEAYRQQERQIAWHRSSPPTEDSDMSRFPNSGIDVA